jgi:glutaconate CoA-transferase subunit B
LSIGDGELAETADAVVSVPEIFAYWLQAGRIDVGFLGGAQLDKFGNINSTVIGQYDAPRTRLPGAGGAPEIAASAGAVMVIMRQSKRAFVERCDFRSSIGFGDGPGDRERLGLRGGGVRWVITDLGVLEPDADTCELTVRALHGGVTREQMSEATGWAVRFANDVGVSAPPNEQELTALRELQAA